MYLFLYYFYVAFKTAFIAPFGDLGSLTPIDGLRAAVQDMKQGRHARNHRAGIPGRHKPGRVRRMEGMERKPRGHHGKNHGKPWETSRFLRSIFLGLLGGV